jgi:hypothetical protein
MTEIYYLSEKNINDDIFLKDFSELISKNSKSIVLHSPAGTESHTRFFTKKISGFLSESMVTNIPLSGDQRSVISENQGSIQIRLDFIQSLFNTLNCIVLNTLGVKNQNIVFFTPIEIIQSLRNLGHSQPIILFPNNPLSPLGNSGELIESLPDFEKYSGIYEEETPMLEFALKASPAVFKKAKNYSF